jgi:hypothetical protein
MGMERYAKKKANKPFFPAENRVASEVKLDQITRYHSHRLSCGAKRSGRQDQSERAVRSIPSATEVLHGTVPHRVGRAAGA